MAKLSWKGGRDMGTLAISLEAKGRELIEDSKEAVALSVAEGALMTQDLLEAATTRTGERRAEEFGGYPGRHDTGNMVGSLSYSDEDELEHRGNIWMGFFGWARGQFEQYFRDQDLGEGDIPAARALPVAQIRAEQAFKRRMSRVVQGRGGR